MKKFKTVKDGFLWGGSVSAIQVDGVGPKNIRRSDVIHDFLYEKYPDKHWSGIGPAVTINFIDNFKEDIDLFSQIGVNSIRYGFMWSRLFPDGENLNEDAVKYYHEVIDYFLSKKIDPMMQLFHFDTPMWVKEVGGWSEDIVTERFAKFSKFVFEEYGKKIEYFATFNEPAVMKGIFEQEDWYKDGKVTQTKIWRETIGLAKANTASYLEFQKAKKSGFLKENSKLGVIVNYNKAYTISDAPSAEDKEAIKDLDAFMNIYWTDILVVGKINERVRDGLDKFGITFPITKEEEQYISQTDLDFIGENYYLPWRGEAPTNKNPKSPEQLLFNVGVKKNARFNKFRGWEIYPKGLEEALVDIWNLYKKPIFIGENGIGVDNEYRFRNDKNVIDDEYRISFVKEHIESMKNAMDKGVNVFGYHMWSMIDLWSAYSGFKNRYGFIEVDLDNNLQRKFKKSAYWYKEFIKTGSFGEEYEKADVIAAAAMEESVKLKEKHKNIGLQNYETLFN